MSGLYGKWLDASYDYDAVTSRLGSLNSEFYPKYEERVESINSLACKFVHGFNANVPNLKLQVSYPNILLLVGKYFNDIVHYKVWHQITDTEVSKMFAHTIKWAQINPPVFSSADALTYKSMNAKERELALNINLIFIGNLIAYLQKKHNPNLDTSHDFDKVSYLIKTGQFDEKSVAACFS